MLVTEDADQQRPEDQSESDCAMQADPREEMAARERGMMP